jgi:flagellar motor protein MotB
MKVNRIISTAILSLLLGVAAPADAQQEQHDEKQDHPEKQQSKPQQAEPEQQHAQQQRQSEQKQQQPQHAQQQQQQQQDQNKQQQHAQQQRGNEQPPRAQQQQRVEQSAWQEHRARSWQSDHRTWGYNGYRIPDDRYRGYFGPDHGFRIYGLPFLVVGGYPRFQYEGYWFSAVDPWPEYWANDWYDTDDVYVTYVDNGYYLFNRRYPDVAIAVSISM